MNDRRAGVCPKCGKSNMQFKGPGDTVRCVWIDCEYIYTDEMKRRTDKNLMTGVERKRYIADIVGNG